MKNFFKGVNRDQNQTVSKTEWLRATNATILEVCLSQARIHLKNNCR